MSFNNHKSWSARKLLLPLLALLLFCIATAASATTASAAALKGKLKTDIVYAVPGQEIHITTKARGGSGVYRYKYRIQKRGEKVKTIRKFRTYPEAVFTPQEDGDYTLYLYLKDDEGAKKIYTKRIWVKALPNDKELALRKKVVKNAWKWRKVKEGSAGHKEIIDTYNGYQNNFYRTSNYSFYGTFSYRHYTLSMSESWCDAFVSAVFIKAGLAHISGVECGCPWHILWLQHHNSFVEADDYIPFPGDIIFYSWGDSGKGDCTGIAAHVGLVRSVSPDGTITTIEGNYDDRVKQRKIKIDSQYIRGYGVPKYSGH